MYIQFPLIWPLQTSHVVRHQRLSLFGIVRVKRALLYTGERAALSSKTSKSRLIDLLSSLEQHQCVSLLTEKQPTPACLLLITGGVKSTTTDLLCVSP